MIIFETCLNPINLRFQQACLRCVWAATRVPGADCRYSRQCLLFQKHPLLYGNECLPNKCLLFLTTAEWSCVKLQRSDLARQEAGHNASSHLKNYISFADSGPTALTASTYPPCRTWIYHDVAFVLLCPTIQNNWEHFHEVNAVLFCHHATLH